jgi:CRP-like cAMP-binding protein
VLVSGGARVLKAADTGRGAAGFPAPGDSFGGIALLERTARTATVRASSDVELLRLDRADFDELFAAIPDLKAYLELQVSHRCLHNFFWSYGAVATLPLDALSTMLAELEPVAVEAGTVMIREDDPRGPMYVVEDGRLRVFTERSGTRRRLSYLRRGDVGERYTRSPSKRTIIRGSPRSARSRGAGSAIHRNVAGTARSPGSRRS